MAITVTQDPTFFNVTKNPVVFVVSGSTSTLPQYQFVVDVRTAPDNTLRSRVIQYPNPEGVAVFDVSHIMGDYITHDATNFRNTGIVDTFGSEFKYFNVYAGEQYGTSASSSVTLYDGLGSPGVPAVTGPSTVGGNYAAWGGRLDYTTGDTTSGNGGWNFGDYFGTTNVNRILTSHRSTTTSAARSNAKMGPNDYALMSILDSNSNLVNSNTNVVLYDSNNSVIGSTTIGNAQAGIYANYVPIGPRNLVDAGNFTQSQIDNTSWYYVTNLGDTTNLFKTFTMDKCQNNFERRNFLFVNKWGFYENWGCNLPLKQNTSVSRDEYRKSVIPYSNTTAVNDFSRRGFDYYNSSLNDTFEFSSPYVTNDEAKVISELIESEEVYLQVNNLDMGLGTTIPTTFIPVQITNSSYQHKTNKLQKIFKYDIQYKLANQRPI